MSRSFEKEAFVLAYHGGSPPQTARGALPTLGSLDELARFTLTETDVFFRYSRGPHVDRGEPSVDPESGLLLPGLPVVSLKPEPWWTRDRRDWIARQLTRHIQEQRCDHAVAWVVLGRLAGYGPDREPLLWPWTPVAWVSDAVLEEAQARYQTKFTP